MAGGEPVLVFNAWTLDDGGDALRTCALRLSHQQNDAHPIIAPSNDHELAAELILELRPLLARFVGANVIPFERADAH